MRQHRDALPWSTVTVNGNVYLVCQLDLRDGQFSLVGEPFSRGRKWYGAGSWLVKGPTDTYAWALTNDEYVQWQTGAHQP